MRRRNHHIVKYLRTWLSSRVNIIFWTIFHIIDNYNVLISKFILWYELSIFISYMTSMKNSNYLKTWSIYFITLDIWMLYIIIQLHFNNGWLHLYFRNLFQLAIWLITTPPLNAVKISPFCCRNLSSRCSPDIVSRRIFRCICL